MEYPEEYPEFAVCPICQVSIHLQPYGSAEGGDHRLGNCPSPDCGAVYHVACWEDLKGCAVISCACYFDRGQGMNTPVARIRPAPWQIVEQLRVALQNRSARQITGVLSEHTWLESYPPANGYHKAINWAKACHTALQNLEQCLNKFNDEQAVQLFIALHDEFFDRTSDFSQGLNQRVQAAQARQEVFSALYQALRDHDDQRIAQLYDPKVWKNVPYFDETLRQKAELAKRRIEKLDHLNQALDKTSFKRMIKHFDPKLLYASRSVHPDLRRRAASTMTNLIKKELETKLRNKNCDPKELILLSAQAAQHNCEIDASAQQKIWEAWCRLAASEPLAPSV